MPSTHRLAAGGRCPAAPPARLWPRSCAAQRAPINGHSDHSLSRCTGPARQGGQGRHIPRPHPPAIAASSSSDAATLAWARACVIENRAESGDSAFRTLRLSVADDVPLLSGSVRASVRGKSAGVRWIDGYRAPGQQVGVRLVAEGEEGGTSATTTQQPSPPPPHARLVLASSPYEALRESAALAASIIEVMVDREEGGDGGFSAALGRLAPGAELEVSTVQGAGWAPMFSEDDGAPALAAALEAGRPLLVIGAGAPGAAALRATLEWTPVQAAASAGRVGAVMVAGRGGPGGAPYLVWYDLWRGWGVDLHATALGAGAGDLGLEAALFSAIFGNGGDAPGALRCLVGGGGGGVGGVTVLVGGCPRPVALAIMRRLEAEGVPSTHILFGDPYF